MRFKVKGNAKRTHPDEKPQEGQTGSSRPAVSSLCWQTNYKTTQNFQALHFWLNIQWWVDNHTPLFSPFFFYCSCSPQRPPSWPQNTSAIYIALIKYTPCPHKYNGQKHTQRAVIIKSFGMVQSTMHLHSRCSWETQQLKLMKRIGIFWNELNEMQSSDWFHTGVDGPILLAGLNRTLWETRSILCC